MRKAETFMKSARPGVSKAETFMKSERPGVPRAEAFMKSQRPELPKSETFKNPRISKVPGISRIPEFLETTKSIYLCVCVRASVLLS